MSEHTDSTLDLNSGAILVVDDNRMNRTKLSISLKQQGHEVTLAEDGEQALEMLDQASFDVVLLDIIMPGIDGYKVLERMKNNPGLRHIPVIVISALDEVDSAVRCIEIGAEDYLPKPFNPRELLARIKSILRRAQPPADTERVLQLGEIRLDTRTHKAAVGDAELRLTGTEFEILKCLLETPGKVVNKERLSERALGRRLLPYDRSVDTHISNLRGKLERAGNRNETIQNQRGVGYLLIPGS